MIKMIDVLDYIDALAMSDKPFIEKHYATRHLRVLLKRCLSPNRKRAYDLLLLMYPGAVTYKDVSQKLGISETYACTLLNDLHGLGLTVKSMDDENINLTRHKAKLPGGETDEVRGI